MHLVNSVIQLFGCGFRCSGADCETCEGSCKQPYRNGNNTCGVHAHSSVEGYCFCSCNIQLSTQNTVYDLLCGKLTVHGSGFHGGKILRSAEQLHLKSGSLPTGYHLCQHICGLESNDRGSYSSNCRSYEVNVLEQQGQRAGNKAADIDRYLLEVAFLCYLCYRICGFVQHRYQAFADGLDKQVNLSLNIFERVG